MLRNLRQWSCENTLSDILSCFFFQAEDGIRDLTVTGVQTCALPISGVVAVLALIQSVDPALFQTITGARTFTRGGVLLEIGPHRVLVGRDAGPEVIRAVVLVSQDLAAKRRAYVELDARFAGQVVVRRRATASGGGEGA